LRKIINAKFLLETQVAPCRRVWIEKKVEPLTETMKAFREAILRVDSLRGALPQADNNFHEVKYLHWENSHSGQKVDFEKVSKKLLNITTFKSIDSIISFWLEVGPLFPGNRISLSEALTKIGMAMQFITLQLSTTPSKGMPAPVSAAEAFLVNPLKQKVIEHPEVRKWTWVHLGLSLPPVLKPARRNDWPIFIVPKSWPVYRGDIIDFTTAEINRNIMRRLQQYVKFNWTKNGSLVIQPASLYEAILAWHCFNEPYVKEKADIATREKQDALSYFRTYKKRGISDEQYTVIKQSVNQAWDDGVRKKEQLRSIGRKAVPEYFNKEDETNVRVN